MINEEELKKLNAEEASLVASTLACYDIEQVREQMQKEVFLLKVNDKVLSLTQGKEFTLF